MKTKYRIDFTREQLNVVQQALEFMSRFQAGQVTDFTPNFRNWLVGEHMKTNDYAERRDMWEEHLYKAKEYLFNNFNQHESFGIGSNEQPQENKIAYDIYRPILELFHEEYVNEHPDRPGHYSVYGHQGLRYSEEGRIKIEKINSNE